MSEEEKMLAGQIYDANYDKELFKKRLLAKELCQKFNNCEFTKIEEKKRILEKLFQKEIDIIGLSLIFIVIMDLIYI